MLGSRLATIRDTHRRFGVVIDTHTADGLKVGREHLDWGVPMIVLETPKGWTGPREIDGKPVEGTWRSHQVPMGD